VIIALPHPAVVPDHVPYVDRQETDHEANDDDDQHLSCSSASLELRNDGCGVVFCTKKQGNDEQKYVQYTKYG
jgi:hypothetical protein